MPPRGTLRSEAALHRVIGDVGELEQRFQRVDAKCPFLAQHRVEHRVIAGKHAGVGRGRRLADIGGADLQHQHRFAGGARQPERGAEALRVAAGL